MIARFPIGFSRFSRPLLFCKLPSHINRTQAKFAPSQISVRQFAVHFTRPKLPPSKQQHKMASNTALIESAKEAAAKAAVAQNFDGQSMQYIGIGSGSTIKYVINAIKATLDANPPPSPLHFVPTGTQSKNDILAAGLQPIALDELTDDTVLDVAFDGADEVDEEFNCVKGGGACLFQEKLVATRAKTFVAVADFRKDSKRLLTSWTYIPIEVAPMAVAAVQAALKKLGCPKPEVRMGTADKEGPLKTDQAFYLIMAPFPPMLTAKDVKEGKVGGQEKGKTTAGDEGLVWDVESLAREIVAIPGVLEVGLFWGENGHQASERGVIGGQRPVSVYLGLEDGSIKIRKAPRKPGQFSAEAGTEEIVKQ